MLHITERAKKPGTPEEVFGRPRQERTRRFLERIVV
jgi:ABC-type histidine transport system ATPase subunit